MGRTKVTARRPRPIQPIEVGQDDALPSGFIEYILALPLSQEVETASEDPDDDQSDLSRPSTKRRKIETYTCPVGSVCVATGELSFSRPCEYPSSHTSTHLDVSTHLALSLSQRGLCISPWRTPPSGNPCVRIQLKPEDKVSPRFRAISEFGGYDSQRSAVGGIWTLARLSMKLEGSLALVKLSLHLFWNEILSPYSTLSLNSVHRSKKLIDIFYPSSKCSSQSMTWSPMDFYDAAYVPPKDDLKPLLITIPGLEATLFPYQNRSLQWLLAREGVQWTVSKDIEPLPELDAMFYVDAFRAAHDASGGNIYISDVFKSITRDISVHKQVQKAIKGGILAEEMGLGKTLEIIGLILLHRRESGISLHDSPQSQTALRPSGATLIVTPEKLRPQWISEISRHAPGLRVQNYQGCKAFEKGEEDRIVNELAEYDVVITTYSILSSELHFVLSPPERPRRHDRAYHRTKSPLVQISWWRVCLDEAQMVENGFSQAAVTAKLIPRVNAWGITGTPVKDDVKDLLGLLKFLHFEPYCSNNSVWRELMTNHKSIFQQLFRSISLRHTKALVRDEISLPPQKRFVITMPFTAVEEQYYQSMFKEMAESCQLSLEGAPLIEDWQPENFEGEMRRWLNRLRQTTLHPEVGVYGRRVLGNKEKPMRTVEEVLDAMLEQTEVAIRSDERAYFSNKLLIGQLFENGPRVKEALEIWEEVRDETRELVSEARTKSLDTIQKQSGNNESQSARNVDLRDLHDFSDSDAGREDDLESKGQSGELRNRLRTALDLHHKAVFFCANAYFQIRENKNITEPDSEAFHLLKKLEDDGYEYAKNIRKEVLREGHRKATRLMTKLEKQAQRQSFVMVPELIIGTENGIESSSIIDGLELLYGELNEQANVIDEWREHLVVLLLQPLIDEEDNAETTGEELNNSTELQEELMVYIQALRAVVADRQDAITGQTNVLVRHEVATSKDLAMGGGGPAPEKLLTLLNIRDAIKPTRAKMSMRGAIAEFRTLQSRLSRDMEENTREGLEHEIAFNQMKATQNMLNEQNKAAASLESEVESFKKIMNARLEYYRQLQALSDAVNPYDGPRTDVVVEKAKKAANDSQNKVLSGQAKHRYLLGLKEAGSKSNEPRICVICQMPFVTGVLTVCGHQFCKECMMMWFKARHNCPVCKKALTSNNLHDITLKPQQLQVLSEEPSQQAESGGQDEPPQSHSTLPKQTLIYSEFNAEKLAELKNIELDGPSFTTKVDTLVRHLLWLRESDPGAKSIVFSQYKDFLLVLRNAFRRFRIGHASIDEPGGITQFKEDPAVECFLLHARAHSSGLNLVNASHVFLCEPLLNTAIELQAIARVDRIGQQHETTVWLYIVSGTVEESIHNLSVRRRMEHMGKNVKAKSKDSTPELLDASIEAANTLELEAAALSKLMSKDRSAGEMVDRGDLWECLFGHVGNKALDMDSRQDDRLKEQPVIAFLSREAAEARKAA